jgi:hypothetical protein
VKQEELAERSREGGREGGRKGGRYRGEKYEIKINSTPLQGRASVVCSPPPTPPYRRDTGETMSKHQAAGLARREGGRAYLAHNPFLPRSLSK